MEVTGGATTTHVGSHQEVYDNDQVIHLMRMLPLEPGYQVKFSLLPIWTANIIEVGLKVTGQKTCRVPAGEFDCYAAEIDLGESYWFSTGPGRYPLKLKMGGVIVELAEIGRTEPGATVAFGLEDFGFSGSLPTGWLSYEHRRSGRDKRATMRLLDPGAAAISSLEVHRCPPGRCPSLQEIAEGELSGARKRFEAYELREGSWTERTIDGRPAISFVGDYQRNGEPWVQYRLYTLTGEVGLEFIFRTTVDRFEELRAVFDSIAENIEAG